LWCRGAFFENCECISQLFTNAFPLIFSKLKLEVDPEIRTTG
jgi:hypothetical protein